MTCGIMTSEGFFFVIFVFQMLKKKKKIHAGKEEEEEGGGDKQDISLQRFIYPARYFLFFFF